MRCRRSAYRPLDRILGDCLVEEIKDLDLENLRYGTRVGPSMPSGTGRYESGMLYSADISVLTREELESFAGLLRPMKVVALKLGEAGFDEQLKHAHILYAFGDNAE